MVLEFCMNDINFNNRDWGNLFLLKPIIINNTMFSKDQIKLFFLQFILISGIILINEEQSYLFLFFYILASVFCILNPKYILYIFYSSIWISLKLHFEIANVIIRLSDIIFLLLFSSWLINSFYNKRLMIDTPKKNDYVMIGFVLLRRNSKKKKTDNLIIVILFFSFLFLRTELQI